MGSSNNSVEKNLISKNFVGIVLKDSSFNNISLNDLAGNLVDNIKLSSESINNNIYRMKWAAELSLSSLFI